VDTTPELPLADDRPERADAARNRRRILAAAEALATERGLDGLSVAEVAQAAGVGVGTIYRRFGDRTGLAYALLDRGERAFQTAFLSGPPPLGPGAPAADRLRAFLHAYVDRLGEQAALLVMAETSDTTARYTSDAYAVHHAHVAALLAEIDRASDADHLADVLLAAVDARLYLHNRARSIAPARMKAGLDRLLEGVTPRTRRSPAEAGLRRGAVVPCQPRSPRSTSSEPMTSRPSEVN
jgi:AcrR family transcriptional regulator